MTRLQRISKFKRQDAKSFSEPPTPQKDPRHVRYADFFNLSQMRLIDEYRHLLKQRQNYLGTVLYTKYLLKIERAFHLDFDATVDNEASSHLTVGAQKFKVDLLKRGIDLCRQIELVESIANTKEPKQNTDSYTAKFTRDKSEKKMPLMEENVSKLPKESLGFLLKQRIHSVLEETTESCNSSVSSIRTANSYYSETHE